MFHLPPFRLIRPRVKVSEITLDLSMLFSCRALSISLQRIFNSIIHKSCVILSCVNIDPDLEASIVCCSIVSPSVRLSVSHNIASESVSES